MIFSKFTASVPTIQYTAKISNATETFFEYTQYQLQGCNDLLCPHARVRHPYVLLYQVMNRHPSLQTSSNQSNNLGTFGYLPDLHEEVRGLVQRLYSSACSRRRLLFFAKISAKTEHRLLGKISAKTEHRSMEKISEKTGALKRSVQRPVVLKKQCKDRRIDDSFSTELTLEPRNSQVLLFIYPYFTLQFLISSVPFCNILKNLSTGRLLFTKIPGTIREISQKLKTLPYLTLVQSHPIAHPNCTLNQSTVLFSCLHQLQKPSPSATGFSLLNMGVIFNFEKVHFHENLNFIKGPTSQKLSNMSSISTPLCDDCCSALP